MKRPFTLIFDRFSGADVLSEPFHHFQAHSPVVVRALPQTRKRHTSVHTVLSDLVDPLPAAGPPVDDCLLDEFPDRECLLIVALLLREVLIRVQKAELRLRLYPPDDRLVLHAVRAVVVEILPAEALVERVLHDRNGRRNGCPEAIRNPS